MLHENPKIGTTAAFMQRACLISVIVSLKRYNMKKKKVSVQRLSFGKQEIVPLMSREKTVIVGGVSLPKPGMSLCVSMCFTVCVAN